MVVSGLESSGVLRLIGVTVGNEQGIALDGAAVDRTTFDGGRPIDCQFSLRAAWTSARATKPAIEMANATFTSVPRSIAPPTSATLTPAWPR